MIVRLWALALITISMAGCSYRAPARWNLQPVTPAAAAASRVDDWNTLGLIARDTAVEVHLDNGSRTVQRFRGFTATQIDLETGSIERPRVAAVVIVARDRFLNGVLIGATTGLAPGLVLATAPRSDIDPDFLAVSIAYSSAVGAGLGALFDGGLATPPRVVYLKGDNGSPLEKRDNWTVEVRPDRLIGWVQSRVVEMMLRDGVYLKGRVAAGDERSLTLEVRDSSDSKLKGRLLTVGVERIGTVAFRENIGGNRLAAGLAGGISGFFLGSTAGIVSESGPAAVVGASLGILLGTGTMLAVAQERNGREVMLVIR